MGKSIILKAILIDGIHDSDCRTLGKMTQAANPYICLVETSDSSALANLFQRGVKPQECLFISRERRRIIGAIRDGFCVCKYRTPLSLILALEAWDLGPLC